MSQPSTITRAQRSVRTLVATTSAAAAVRGHGHPGVRAYFGASRTARYDSFFCQYGSARSRSNAGTIWPDEAGMYFFASALDMTKPMRARAGSGGLRVVDTVHERGKARCCRRAGPAGLTALWAVVGVAGDAVPG